MDTHEKTKKKLNSNQFDWYLDQDEVYSFLNKSWSVSRAKKLLLEGPPKDLIMADLSSLKKEVARPKKNQINAIHRFDWDKIDKEDLDLDFPVILITFPKGQLWPIDGWHRIAKGLDEGNNVFPCFIMDDLETGLICIE